MNSATFVGDMLRLLAVLACLGALEAVAVYAQHAPKMDVVVPAPPHLKKGVVFTEKKVTSEPATLSMPLKNIDVAVSVVRPVTLLL